MKISLHSILKTLVIAAAVLPLSLSFLLSQQVVKTVDEKLRPVPGCIITYSCGNDTTQKRSVLSRGNGFATIPCDHIHQVHVRSVAHEDQWLKNISADTTIVQLVPKPFVTDAVVATGYANPRWSTEVVHNVRTLDAEQIEMQSAPNLEALLSRQSGVEIRQDPVLGATLSIQGLSGENVGILVDGVPVIGRLDGGVDLSQISLDNVERIEIVEGAMSVEYGANSLAGVINIITKRANHHSSSVKVGSLLQSNNTANVSIDANIPTSAGSIHLNGSRHLFGGKEHDSLSRVYSWKPREKYFANLSYDRTMGDVDISLTSSYMHDLLLNWGTPRAPLFERAFDDEFRTERINSSVRSRYTLNDSMGVDLMAGYSHYNRQKLSVLKDLTTLETTVLEQSEQDTSTFDQVLVRAGWFGTLGFVSDADFRLGAEYLRDGGTGRRMERGEQAISQVSVFGTLDVQMLDDLIVQFGLRAAENSEYDTPLAPSLHMRYALTNRWSLRTSISQSYRVPTLKELYLLFVDVNHNIQGNPSLTPETSISGNASIEYQHVLKQHVYKASANVYVNDIDNRISLVDAGSSLYTYKNADSYGSVGGSTQFSYFREGLTARLALSLNHQTQSFASGSETSTTTPGVTLESMYDIPGTGVSTSLSYKYNGEVAVAVEDEQGNTVERIQEDYHTLDVSARRTFLDFIEVRLGVNNILDVTDVVSGIEGGGAHSSASHSTPVSTGRSVFLSLQLSFEDL